METFLRTHFVKSRKLKMLNANHNYVNRTELRNKISLTEPARQTETRNNLELIK